MDNKKFIQSFDINDYEVLTEDGWKDITHIHKTIKFDVWKITTKNFELKCADEHIVIDKNFKNIYVKDLKIGDAILTKNGIEKIESIEKSESQEHMYDITVNSENHTYYTNGILSHNSTISTIYLTWYGLFHKDKLIAIVADKEKTSKNILGRIKEAYKRFPLWLQQGVREWNAKSILLENGTQFVISSTTGTALTGESIALLYIDEFSKIPAHLIHDFMDSVFPTVEANPNAKILIVSTPKGMNHWYEIWRLAVQKENDFFPIKINWWEVPGRDEAFKKRIIKSRGMLHWKQEYEASFLGSSSTLVEPDVLEKIKTIDPIDYRLGHALQIYERPIPGVNYVIGVDTAKGTGNDYSVIQVLKIINRKKLEQVAIYRCNTISTTNYAQVCIEVSKLYNEAAIMIENNDIGDGVANAIWHHYEYDKIINIALAGGGKSEIGIRSTKKSKLEGNLNLKKYIEEGWLKINDKQTVYELSRYEEIEGKINVFAAINNQNDDCVTSLIWAVYYLMTKYYEDPDETYDGIPEIEKKNRIEDNYPLMIIDSGNMPVLDEENMRFLEEGGNLNDFGNSAFQIG